MRMALVPIRDYESYVVNNEAHSFKMGFYTLQLKKEERS